MLASRVVAVIAAAVVAVVVAVAVIYALGANAKPASTLPNPYYNRAYGFTVQYPDGWKGVENYPIDANTHSIATFYDKNSSISIVAKPMPPGESFDTVDSQAENATLGKHSGYTMSLQSKGTGIISGVPAHVRIWDKKSTQGDFREQTIHLVHAGRLYSISFISPSQLYDTEVGQFSRFLNSFSFG